MLSLITGLGRKPALSARCFLLGVPCLVVLSIGCPSSVPIAAAGELDGRGLSCVGVKASAEDLYYGFVFSNGRVKALSII